MTGDHFDMMAWDTTPETPRRQFAVEFDAHGPFIWIGEAADAEEAIELARVELAAKNHEFTGRTARLVSLKDMS